MIKKFFLVGLVWVDSGWVWLGSGVFDSAWLGWAGLGWVSFDSDGPGSTGTGLALLGSAALSWYTDFAGLGSTGLELARLTSAGI